MVTLFVSPNQQVAVSCGQRVCSHLALCGFFEKAHKQKPIVLAVNCCLLSVDINSDYIYFIWNVIYHVLGENIYVALFCEKPQQGPLAI